VNVEEWLGREVQRNATQLDRLIALRPHKFVSHKVHTNHPHTHTHTSTPPPPHTHTHTHTAKSRPPGTCILREPLVELSASALEVTPAQVALRWAVQQGAAVVPNSLRPPHILANACLHAFTMARFRLEVLNEMSAVRSLRFADPARPPVEPPMPLAQVAAEGVVFQDDGAVLPPGSDYEYLELTVEVFDRLDLGDVAELLVEPKTIQGAFPGMDVEPVEE
jgi:hypothetical protein